jgi:predicted RNase H-like HicB family nuclease
MTTTTTYKAEAYRDENGTWCARVDELHANTDARSFRELRSNLAEAIEVSFDEILTEPFTVEIYVREEDLTAAAAAECGGFRSS